MSGAAVQSRLAEADIEQARSSAIIDVARMLGAEVNPRSPESGVPCPGCGGTDRFSCNPAKNVFFCRASGTGGDAIALVRHVHGSSFEEAVTLLTGRQAVAPGPHAGRRKPAADNSYRQEARRRAYGLWRRAAPAGKVVCAYFGARGIPLPDPVPNTLREFDTLEYWHTPKGEKEGRVVGSGPAMVAAITDHDGRFIGLHRTWIDTRQANGKARITCPKTGDVLDAKKVSGSQRGGRIVLRGSLEPQPLQPGGRRGLVIGEGIETVLAYASLSAAEDGPDLWAGINLDNMSGKATEKIRHPSMTTVDALGRERRVKVSGPHPDPHDDDCLTIPGGCYSHVTLLGDGDSDRFTTQAAMDRARRRHERADLPVAIDWAPDGLDFADVLAEREPRT